MVGTKAIAAWTIVSLTAGLASAQIQEETGDRGASPSSRPTPDLAAVAKRIIHQTNDFRKQHGRQQVRSDSKLMKTAADFAQYMAEHDKYGHTADGRRPAQRASQHGYEYCIVTENIAYQYSSRGFGGKRLARRFENGWEDSPGHRKNMLDRDVTETGVGVARSASSGAYYAVQMFGRPKSKQIEFQVANPGADTVEYTLKGRGSQKDFSLPPRVTRTHQRCRPGKLEFQEDGKRRTIAIENGGRYTVAGKPDQVSAQRDGGQARKTQ